MSGTEQTTATLMALGNELLAEGRIEQASAVFIAAGYIDADAGRTVPAAPSGHNGTDYQWVCVESCTADDPHGEHCDWQTPAPSPDTVTVPKAEWDVVLLALARVEKRTIGVHPEIGSLHDLLYAVRQAAGAVR